MPLAARVRDLHICPLVTVIPHGGGPVLPGSIANVLTDGDPAARLADLAACIGSTDAIAIGSAGCLINNLPAARVGDSTCHGGAIVTGGPTVFIGGPRGRVTMVRRGDMFIIVNRDLHVITLVGVQEYSGSGASQAYVDSAIECINSTWSGPTMFEGRHYDVDARITGRYNDGSAPSNPMSTGIAVEYTAEPTSRTMHNDPASQPYYGRTLGMRRAGHQHSTEDDNGDVGRAHEFGHAMGLRDEYVEGPRAPDGTRTVVPTGPIGGLMGYCQRGSRPTPENFSSLITGDGLAP